METTNGAIYSVNENLEIERYNPETGLRKVFVFQDLSIGNNDGKRKEVVFYSYDITPTGERINKQRHSFSDFESEFIAFKQSAVWKEIQNKIIIDFLRKIEFTEIL